MELDLLSKLVRNVIVYIILHKNETLTKDHHAETSLKKKRFFLSNIHKYPTLNCIHLPSLDQYFKYFARVFEGL